MPTARKEFELKSEERHLMGRSLSPVLRRELENLDKDSESRRSAMKALKCYVKDLDSKALPHFLAQVSETKEPGSSFGEFTISLYEVLARVHGRNIVPQINNIMSAVIRNLSLSVNSFPLQQACSKVVIAIARFGIDPSTSDVEKIKIIFSLCKPLSDLLIGSLESLTSGAALCLKALVECDNWRYADLGTLNELCLKITSAMEEKQTQTNSHMGLVMALAKNNSLAIEAYSRALLRSGLEVLSAGASENTNSQKRFSAIQMINSLMKCVDSRSYSSEIDKIIEVMDKSFQGDQMPFVRGAAFEALQTAKLINIQKSPISRSNSNLMDDCMIESPESRTVNSFLEFGSANESPLSVKVESRRRSARRLWSDKSYNELDVSLKDGVFDALKKDVKISEMVDEPDAFSGFVQASAAESSTQETTVSTPQKSGVQLNFDDAKIYSSPRKLIWSIQKETEIHVDSNSNKSNDVCRKMSKAPSINSQSRDQESVIDGSQTSSKRFLKQLIDDENESVSSTDDILEDTTFKNLHNADKETIIKSRSSLKFFVSVLLTVLFIFVSVYLPSVTVDPDEQFVGLAPT